MIKYQVLICLVLGVALATILKTTPEELHTRWANVSAEIKQAYLLQHIIHPEQFQKLLILIQSLQLNLTTEIYALNLKYYTELKGIFVDSPATIGTAEIECIDAINQELLQYDQSIIASVDTLVSEAELVSDEILAIVDQNNADVDQLNKEIVQCSDSDCATVLNKEVTQLYENFTLNTLVISDKLAEVVDQIYNTNVARHAYNATVDILVEEARACLEE